MCKIVIFKEVRANVPGVVFPSLLRLDVVVDVGEVTPALVVEVIIGFFTVCTRRAA